MFLMRQIERGEETPDVTFKLPNKEGSFKLVKESVWDEEYDEPTYTIESIPSGAQRDISGSAIVIPNRS